MKEIITQAGVGAFTRSQQRRRSDLLCAVEQSPQLQKAVEEAFERKQAVHSDERHDQIKRARFDYDAPPCDSTFDPFLLDVDETVKKSCLANFIDCTGNAQTLQTICIVCAGEFMSSETSLVDIMSIPNRHLLVPSPLCYHHAQEAVNSMLLYTSAILNHEEVAKGHVCTSCMYDLRRNLLPAHALANGLWVGPVPRELSILSLPERILIALYYPAAFVIKLYPQQKGARQWDISALNSGLRGNVSTYRLNTQDICSMIQGDLLPRHPDILPATIAVSIIGPHNLPARCLPSILSVNRLRVRAALQFLKKNNRLYRNIQISEETLALLPENGVPFQLLSVIKFSDEVNLLEQEREGYVVDDDDVEGACFHVIGMSS